MTKKAAYWMRRDLRLNDNHALFRALSENEVVLPVFIFDEDILGQLEKPYDPRVEFIHQEISKLKEELQLLGSDLLVYHGKPLTIWQEFCETYEIQALYCNTDYEPSAIQRDHEISRYLATKNIAFKSFKDHCIFDYTEVLKDDGKPYTVFTPYSRKWKSLLNDQSFIHYDCQGLSKHFYQGKLNNIPSLESMGFKPCGIPFPSQQVNSGLIKNYAERRDIPSLNATSRLSLHFRFGTISIRES